MEPICKYLRTHHVEGSGIQAGDDGRHVALFSELAGKYNED